MGWPELTAALVSALAWPAAAVTIALALRSRLRDILDSGLTKLKAGPFEAEWQRTALETRAAVEAETLRASDELEKPPSEGSVLLRLRHLAESSPELAIIGGFQLINQRIQQLSGAVVVATSDRIPHRPHFQKEVSALYRIGLLSEQSLSAFDNLRRLRNLAVHRPDLVTTKQVIEYLDLVEMLLDTLDQSEKLAREIAKRNGDDKDEPSD